MKRIAFILVLGLAGCEAVVPQATANYKLSSSRDALQKCLMANTTDPGKCETLRQVYAMDLAHYQATMGTGSAQPAYIPYYNGPPMGTPAVHGQ
jgi:hypothetical protein